MMKKPLYLMGISLAVLLASASCSQRPTTAHYVVQGELSDSASHGKTIYMTRYDDNKRIDSTVVEGKCFRFEGMVDTSAFCRIDITPFEYASLMLEPGDITVYPTHELCVQPSGTPLNEQYAAIAREQDSIYAHVRQKRKELQENYPDPKAFQAEWKNFYAQYLGQINRRGLELFQQHADDAVCTALFGSIWGRESSLETREQICQLLSPRMAATAWGSHYVNGVKALRRTAEGMPFADIAGTDAEGAATTLSDYVGKGNYVLMDIWASWCSPCKGEIPNLRLLHDRYGDKGLTVVGIFTWDKAEHLKPTMEKEQICWPQIADTANVAMSTYGTDGIPFIVLFGPDGTILKRNLRGSEMIEAIDKIMSQNKK